MNEFEQTPTRTTGYKKPPLTQKQTQKSIASNRTASLDNEEQQEQRKPSGVPMRAMQDMGATAYSVTDGAL